MLEYGAICIAWVFIALTILWRNHRAYKVKRYFIFNAVNYNILPHLKKMVFSFKPLTIKYWGKWIEEQKRLR